MSYILDALRKSEQERLRGKLPDLNRFGEEDKPASGHNRWVWILGGALLLTNAVGLAIWLSRPAATPVAEVAAERSDSTQSDSAAAAVKMDTPGKPVNADTGAVQNLPASATPAQAMAAAPVSPPSTVPGTPPAGSAAVAAPAAVAAGNPAPGVAATVPAATVPAGTVPAGTVYYVTPGTPVAGQQIVVVPAAGAIAPGSNVVVQVPPQTAATWPSPGAVAQPPPPVPPPPTPVNLDQALDAAGASNPTPNVSYLPQLDELPDYLRSQIPDMTFSSHMYSSMPRFRSVVINGTRVKEGQMIGNNIQVNEITETGVILSVGGTLFQVDVLGKWAQ